MNTLSGVGVGLRARHYREILAQKPSIAWFEVLADNYIKAAGPDFDYLVGIAEHYPLALHGVGMSIGSTDALNWSYLKALRQLIDAINPVVVSDHLCWISAGNRYIHELMPIPQTRRAVDLVTERIDAIQQFLGRRIMVENVSRYLTPSGAELDDGDFVAEILEKADCDLLLDVSNLIVNERNNQSDPTVFLEALPPSRIKQLHLGGFSDCGHYILDSHSNPINERSWAMYAEVILRFGAVPTLIEWDDDLPSLADLLAEAQKAQRIIESSGIQRMPTERSTLPQTETLESNIAVDTIATWQQDLGKALLDRRLSLDDVAKTIEASERFSAHERLNVYRQTIYSNLTSVLREIYPVCDSLVGEEFFDAAAARYIANYASKSPDLNDFGESFSLLLADLPNIELVEYLPDMARLELVWHQTHFSPAGLKLDPSQLTTIKPDDYADFRFSLPSSMTLLRSDYALDAIFAAHNKPKAEPFALDQPCRLAIWRNSDDFRIDALSEVEWEIMSGVSRQRSLSQIVSSLAQVNRQDDFVAALPTLVARGMIGALKV